MTYFKFTHVGGASHSGAWTVGEARTVDGPIVPCSNGIHFCAPTHLSRWIKQELYLFEDMSPDETVEHEGSKMVTRSGRIVERVDAWNRDAWQDVAFYAADRAVRVYSANALRNAGMVTEADRLAGLPPITDADSARSAADAADAAARSAAESAAWSAWSASRSAARSAAYSAESAAWSSRSAARSAVYSAESAESAASAAGSAEHVVLSTWIAERIS